MKQGNGFIAGLRRTGLYEQAPKAVLAAIAVSALTCGGDQLEHASDRVLHEWWTLYENGHLRVDLWTVTRDDPAGK